MTDLWLVRHGQTDWNLSGRWQGQAAQAPGLNRAGRSQVQALLPQLNGISFAAIYTSDLLRARQTASLLGEHLGLSPILDPRLREINLGSWEGLLSADIQAQYPRELEARARDPYHFRAPGGESLPALAARVFAAVDEMSASHPQASLLIVSHGVALAFLICRSAGYPPESVYEHIPDNAHPWRISWG